MADFLCSVGLDVGTTSTQMIVSRLTVENRASAFAVPELHIARREILYRSPVFFTPLLDEAHVDGEALGKLVSGQYRAAGIRREQVDTGAVIVTGETARKENAAAVIQALSSFAGDFVVATAGPDLESELAARGAGADLLSEETGKRVLHMDIGGGTANLALLENGKVLQVCCLNVGGRLVQTDETGRITRLSPVLQGFSSLKVGDPLSPARAQSLARQLAGYLEIAAGLRQGSVPPAFQTAGSSPIQPEVSATAEILSFSGGVADCIDTSHPLNAFGDLGPALGQAIRRSLLCRKEYVLGRETIRATVIGAGCHTTRLSGSTVYWQNISFPLKNLQVLTLPGRALPEPEQVRRCLARADGEAVLSLPELPVPDYPGLSALAQALDLSFGSRPLLVMTRQDLAKALGQALALRRSPDAPILCLDRLAPPPGSYLDIGSPVGPALPAVIKTLIFRQTDRRDNP